MRFLFLLVCFILNASEFSFKLDHSSSKFAKLSYIKTGLLWVAHNNVLHGFDQSGKRIYKISTEADIVFFKLITQDQALVSLTNAKVYMLNLQTGELKELAQLPKPMVYGVWDSGVLYAQSAESDIYSVKDGNLIWKIDGIIRQRIFEGQLLLSQNYLLASIKPELLTIVNKLSGLQVYEYVVPNAAWMKFVEKDNQIQIVSDSYFLVLNKETLRKEYSFKFDNMLGCFIHNSIAYVYDNNKIYALYSKVKIDKGLCGRNLDKNVIWSIDKQNALEQTQNTKDKKNKTFKDNIARVIDFENKVRIETTEGRYYILELSTGVATTMIDKTKMPLFDKVQMVKAGRARMKLVFNS